MTPSECYAALELPYGASLDEVHQAHRDLASAWHPDRFAHDPDLQRSAEAKLKRINEAYLTLRDRRGPEVSSREPPEIVRTSRRDPNRVRYGRWGVVAAILLAVCMGALLIQFVGRRPVSPSTRTDAPPATAADPVAALDRRGVAAHESGDFEQAVRLFSEAITREPTDVLYLNRAISSFAMGDFAKAASDCSEAIRINPRSAMAYYIRSYANLKQGLVDEAADDASRAFALDPKIAARVEPGIGIGAETGNPGSEPDADAR